MPESSLKVAINAQVIPGGSFGGIEQAVLGLIHALGQLEDSEVEYVLITDPRAPDWLTPYLGPNQRVVVRPYTFRNRVKCLVGRAKDILWPMRPVLLPLRRVV